MVLSTCLFVVATAQVVGSPTGYAPKVEADDGQAAQARTRIKVPAGWVAELFAAEPHCANLVALDLAPNGDCYVVETFRRDKQVLDMRDHPAEWVEDDLAARTVADRVAWHTRRDPDLAGLRKESERVRLLRDRDRDGRVDWSSVFADGMNEVAAGVAAGVLVRDGAVWLTNMPNLWRLRDRDGDGFAEERAILSSGYGVHYAFVGHDLHGLRMGPDGRLWFSCGDRGLNVVTQEGKHLELPDAGAVLRCEPDGSGLELFHIGLRNPQELQFDEFGDLFTVDNNSDGGDQARLVQIVEGGNSGWNLGWQWARTPTPRSAWNGEEMWKPAQAGQPAWVVPCIRNLVSGPSGLTRDPARLLPGEFADSFLICDFEGQWDNTRVVAFRTERRGAGHAIVFERAFVERGIVATDVEFGADGALYVSDWVGGWNQTGRGRVWRLHDPAVTGGIQARSTQQLLAGGFAGRADGELAGLLAHADQRVRQEAQFALAARGAVDLLATMSRLAADSRARRHAAWGLWQLARGGGKHAARAASGLRQLLAARGDDVVTVELRGQAARALGDARDAVAAPRLLELLAGDADARVRFFAAIALGRLSEPKAVAALLELAQAAGDRDRNLRHAAVMGLVGCADEPVLAGLSAHGSAAVRMAALLALRKRGSAECGRFLADPDRTIVVEAARAIDDLLLTAHLPALAAQLDAPAATEPPLLQRAINVAFRLGGAVQAERLARVAAERRDLPEAIRAEALRALGEFDAPPARDRFLGRFRPCAPREPVGAGVLEPLLERLVQDPANALAEAAVRHVERQKLARLAPTLAVLARDLRRDGAVRVAAIDALAAIRAPELRDVVEATLTAADDRVRGAARRQLARLDPAQALAILGRVVANGTPREQQDAYATLGEMADPRAAELLALEIGRLLAGEVAPAVALDLLEASRRKAGQPLIDAQLAKHAASRPGDDKVAVREECAVGGDADRGRDLFFGRTELQCVKCHRVGGEGAGTAGPDLAGIGARRAPRQLLEAIVAPNRELAAGYAGTTLVLVDDRIVDGRITGESATTWRMATADGGEVEVLKAGVKARRPGLSAMPEGLVDALAPRDLRDLVAYLASLR